MDRLMKAFCTENHINPNAWNRSCNCYGFAFGVCDWLVPYADYDDPWFYGDDVYAMEEDMVNTIILQTGARLIESISELASNEYAVAFRFGETDFHFIRRGLDGKWYEKMGASEIAPVLKKRVFADFWDNGVNVYDSTLRLFAVTFE